MNTGDKIYFIFQGAIAEGTLEQIREDYCGLPVFRVNATSDNRPHSFLIDIMPEEAYTNLTACYEHAILKLKEDYRFKKKVFDKSLKYFREISHD